MHCQCNYCRNDIAFPIPPELVERLIAGNVVLFAGAGISTENPEHSASTFYQEVRHLLSESTTPAFPTLMSKLCSRPDGRLQMVSKIRERISYFQSFQDFYGRMSRFHRAIRPLHMISDVITTNWDDFFEREAGFEPFIYDEDLPLLEGSSRRLIKIHGSINNVGSIVATEEDYRRSFK